MKLSAPQEYVATSTKDFVLFLAGVGSGKTHVLGVITGYLIQSFPGAHGFVGANTYQQLTTSTLKRVREVWSDVFGWKHGRDYVVGLKPPKSFDTSKHQFDDYNGIISFRSGAIVYKGSLDNAKAHDGKEFTWAVLDETKDTRESDVLDTIMTRLRMPGLYVDSKIGVNDKRVGRPWNPLYVFTSPAKVDWLNRWFGLDARAVGILSRIYDKDNFYGLEFADKCVSISSTYHNEENLPDGFIERVLRNLSDEAGKRLIYGNPFVKTGGEFYASFDRVKHVRRVDVRDDLPIHISFDQNVVPYATATLYQITEPDEDGIREIRIFDEICLEPPRAKTEAVCTEFVIRYADIIARNGLFYYGDPSGRKRDTRGSLDDYGIVENRLRRYLSSASDRVPYAHPAVKKRRDFANALFEEKFAYRIVVDPRCIKTIADFEHVKEDPNGKKLKQTKKDAAGRKYEPYGHTSDTFDYFICEVLSNLFDRMLE